MGLSTSKGYLLVSRSNALYTPHAWIPRDLGLSLISGCLIGNWYDLWGLPYVSHHCYQTPMSDVWCLSLASMFEVFLWRRWPRTRASIPSYYHPHHHHHHQQPCLLLVVISTKSGSFNMNFHQRTDERVQRTEASIHNLTNKISQLATSVNEMISKGFDKLPS